MASGVVALFVLLFVVVGIGGTAMWIWGLVDSIQRPDWAYQQTGSSKTMWLVLIIVLGFIPAMIYLFSVRPRLAEAERNAFAGFSPAAPLYPGSASPPGWFPDPTRRHQHRYWDGRMWTASVADGGSTSVDPV